MQIPAFKLERFFSKYEFAAPYLLCSSDCESFTVNEILQLEDAHSKFCNLSLGYTESKGSIKLREEISKIYSKISPEQLLVHAGAEEAIFVFMNIFLQPQDEVIVQCPCYQSLSQIAESLGCCVKPWISKEENNWELDFDSLRSLINERTKLIVINSPHNPTGYLMSKNKLNELIEIAKENKIFLFSDEVYRELEYCEEDRLPSVCDLYENAISLGVMSKTYGLAGLRIGWIASQHSEIVEQMAIFKEYTSICNSGPSEFLAEIALRNRLQLVNRNIGIIKSNLLLLDEFFHQYSNLFNWQKPKAGSIAFPSINNANDIEDFCLKLVKEAGVLLLPGNYYNWHNHSFNSNFRIGFGRKNVNQSISRLDYYLQKYL
ncbi:MAG: aminotransferase class I/II-fold pyridoxal phosphate-dependent enzyme [Candidatus Caenarcaniphilales bacterium]|nr:aminotransferase class I/II-fold pyridoxal phosphate-dependent enzyme [Candidatus Caenarcaniphilales bacterium]